MKKNLIRIATRQSPLALWQAEAVKKALTYVHPELQVELIGMTTAGDKFLGQPLANIGGKGLFVKELEAAILRDEADIAVHSIKDLPAEMPPKLMLATICKRENPCDVLVSAKFDSVKALPAGALIGTSSLRRQCQLAAWRPDLKFANLRGNVGTRINKAEQGEFDAIILAAAGVIRLDLTDKIKEYFDPEKFIPGIAQGAIGIECREDALEVQQLLARLDDKTTRIRVTAERAMNAQFGGNCQIPIGAYATVKNDQLEIRGMVGKPDGSKILLSMRQGNVSDAEQLGIAVAEDLFAQGAKELLNR